MARKKLPRVPRGRRKVAPALSAAPPALESPTAAPLTALWDAAERLTRRLKGGGKIRQLVAAYTSNVGIGALGTLVSLQDHLTESEFLDLSAEAVDGDTWRALSCAVWVPPQDIAGLPPERDVGRGRDRDPGAAEVARRLQATLSSENDAQRLQATRVADADLQRLLLLELEARFPNWEYGGSYGAILLDLPSKRLHFEHQHVTRTVESHSLALDDRGERTWSYDDREWDNDSAFGKEQHDGP